MLNALHYMLSVKSRTVMISLHQHFILYTNKNRPAKQVYTGLREMETKSHKPFYTETNMQWCKQYFSLKDINVSYVQIFLARYQSNPSVIKYCKN